MTDGLSPRQRRIVEAGTKVLAAGGSRGLTHRAVDREAGLAEGSTSAYFRSRAALLAALAEHVARTVADDVEKLGARLAERPDDHAFAVSSTAALFIHWLDPADILTARLELTLSSTRNPAVARIMRTWQHHLVGLVTGIIERAGTPGAERLGVTTVAALDGILLEALQIPADERSDFATRSVAMLLDALTDPRRPRAG